MKLVNIINESNKEISKYLIDLILTPIFLTNPNSLEIMKMVSTCKIEYQAKIISDIVKSIEVLVNENILEIIKIISKEENESKLNLMNAITKNRNILSTNLSVKMLTLINKINIEDIEYIISIANDKTLEKNNRSIIYLEKMLTSTENIKNIYNEAQLEISLSVQREQRTKKSKRFLEHI